MAQTPPPHIVIAGQIPPPYGGQNIMIKQLLDDLQLCPDLKVSHLPFRFTPNFKAARKGGVSKLLELTRVISRLIRLRRHGSIDLFIFPSGGPHTVPLIRDILLLPWVLLMCRKVCLHFHAAGIAERLKAGDRIPRLAAKWYGCCSSAIVMTQFNRCDPKACGIEDIFVIPHQIPDEFSSRTRNQALKTKNAKQFTVLYMGHLCADKGTPALIEAFGRIASDYPDTILELAGEPLAPMTAEKLHDLIRQTGVPDRIRLPGVVRGDKKKKTFGRADLFVFPSVAPYESFGVVMVEAMMWGLPILATDWRGNRDVLGPNLGGILFPPGSEAADEIEVSLRQALEKKALWPEWSELNRSRFLERFHNQHKATDLIKQLLT